MGIIFDEVQLDPKISYGAVGGPTFRTTVITADSGGENRIGWWTNGRLSWNVGTGVKSKAQMTAIIAFFRARKGKLRGFRFKDWTDYTLTLEPLVVAAGSGQTKKTYSDGSGQTEVRTIWKPVNGTVHIYTNSGGTTAAVGWTMNYATGVVTGLANGTYYITCEFDTPVRFDTDQMQVNLEDFSTRQWDSIPVVELLLR